MSEAMRNNMSEAMRANTPEFTPGQLGRAVKAQLETSFEHIRVRAEISRISRPASGHLYFTLKDQDAAIDAVIWRGVASRLGARPEEGLEVIVTGRVSAYPKSSRFQVVVEAMELAGEGALLKLLEQRRKALAAEGLFDEARKQPLPLMPGVIGVVTSPSGAVIRDILHRLAERLPRHVVVWPTRVQGDGAAEEIAAAIRGFDALPAAGGPIPRPDLLIVARGGGSVEDLWAFNEEIVVRAAAACTIPLISAVGHETDTTLIDFTADLRAPTPTAAAERAVPVRAELLAQIAGLSGRMERAASNRLNAQRERLAAAARPLARPDRLFEERRRRLDEAADRLPQAALRAVRLGGERLAALAGRLPQSALRSMRQSADRLGALTGRLPQAARGGVRRAQDRLAGLAPRLRAEALTARLTREARSLNQFEARGRRAVETQLGASARDLAGLTRALEASSYRATLARGYAVVRGDDGLVRAGAETIKSGEALSLAFHDGEAAAVAAGSPARRPKPRDKGPEQGSLL